MTSAAEMEEDRTGIDIISSLNPHEYAKQHISMFAGEERVITIRFAKHLIGVVLDKFGTDIDVRADGDSHIKARISVAVSPQLYGWLVGIGATVAFPEPEVEKFKEYIASIMESV